MPSAGLTLCQHLPPSVQAALCLCGLISMLGSPFASTSQHVTLNLCRMSSGLQLVISNAACPQAVLCHGLEAPAEPYPRRWSRPQAWALGRPAKASSVSAPSVTAPTSSRPAPASAPISRNETVAARRYGGSKNRTAVTWSGKRVCRARLKALGWLARAEQPLAADPRK